MQDLHSHPLSACGGLPPRESVSLGSQVALLPYEPSSLAPLFRGQNKLLYAYILTYVAQWALPTGSGDCRAVTYR